MSQADRVLAALKRAGARGITQIDFDPPVIDGGKPIKRVAARVYELRKGFRIDEVGRRNQCSVYVYIGPLGAVQETSDPVPGRDRVVEPASPAAPPELRASGPAAQDGTKGTGESEADSSPEPSPLFEPPAPHNENDMWRAA